MSVHLLGLDPSRKLEAPSGRCTSFSTANIYLYAQIETVCASQYNLDNLVAVMGQLVPMRLSVPKQKLDPC